MSRSRRRARLAALAAGVALALPISAQSPEEMFHQANRAYDEGRYDDAAEAYRTLLRYRIEDPRLEYNLGNAEFRRGNLGLAILHYERARRLDPSDPDIRANLELARSRRVDRVPTAELPAPLAWLRELQDRLGPDRQAWAGLAIVWLAAALLAWALAEPGRWRAGHGWALALLLLAGTVVAASWYVTVARLEGRRVAVVLQPRVEVLAGPGANNATLATVHEGLDVEVWSERPEWIQVRLPNGVSGWIAREALGMV